MTIKDFDYFILRCLTLGISTRNIASALGYCQSRVRQRIATLRQRYHAKTTRALIRTLLGD